MDLLTAYRERCRAQCVDLDLYLVRDAHVFSGAPDFSALLLPSTITQRYGRMARRRGLRSTRLHALRHYSATELLTAGMDLRTVAGRLGHGSGGGTTLRFYAAWVDEADHRAADAIAGTMPVPDPSSRRRLIPYETLALELQALIENGTLSPGDTLPTVAELVANHGVAAGTVNRAVAHLKAAGLINVQRGQRATVK